MKIGMICFTRNGYDLMNRIACIMDEETECYCKSQRTREWIAENRDLATTCFRIQKESVSSWAADQFAKGHALVFIGATGIAVRAIVGLPQDKLKDSPVLVVDEKGQFVIPLLSGHVGGANALARKIAKKLGGTAIITTATDINEKFAVDVFARENNLRIMNHRGIAQISSKVLAGEMIRIGIEQDLLVDRDSYDTYCASHLGEIEIQNADADVWIGATPKPGATLWLLPTRYVLGVGCRKGKDAASLQAFFERIIAQSGISAGEILCVASVDVKEDEPGIVELAHALDVPFVTYPAAFLDVQPGEFEESEFVRATIGVGNVCERAAIAATNGIGKLVVRKQAEDGMTMALVQYLEPLKFV